MHTTISRCRQLWPLALALRRIRGLGQCLPHRRGEATGSLNTARDWNGELSGIVPTLFPAHTLPPTMLSHLGGRWHLTAHFSRELFLRVPGMAPGS